MTGTAILEKTMTKAQFLDFAETATGNFEFDNGNLIEMSKGTDLHSLIKGDTLTSLKNTLRRVGKKCRVYNSDLAVDVPLIGRVVYPDACVVCSPTEYAMDGRRDIISNPEVVIEVLSDSTEDYDKGGKFDLYCSLPSFREYVLIEQRRPEVRVRLLIDPENNLWKYSTYRGLESSCQLETLGIALPLAEIYMDAKELWAN